MKSNKELISKGVEQITKKVNAEIQRSFQQLKGSYLDDSHTGALDTLEPNFGEKTQNSVQQILDRKVD